MTGREKKKNPRSLSMLMDAVHIGVGTLVVACVVLAFLFPEQNRFLFPVVFWLAALLNGLNGWYRLQERSRDKRKTAGGIAFCLAAALLLGMGILSAAGVWR